MNRKIARLLFVVGSAAAVTGAWLPQAAAADPTQTCDEAIGGAAALNGAALFNGFTVCAQDARIADANYLIIVGQVRSMADMTILTPRNDEAMQRAASLYGEIYYKYGGLGFDEFYREPTNVDAIDARVRGTDLTLREGYDPGWAYKENAKINIYGKIVANSLAQRLWQMRNFALKIQNDKYYELHLAIQKLSAENGGVFHEGTPAAEEHARLTRELDAVGAAIPELPPPEDTTPYVELMEEEPEQADQKLATGFNGPAEEDYQVLKSEADVRQSWLAAALSDDELQRLISSTDFSKYVLIAVGHGLRNNASGKIIVSAGHGRGGYTVETRLGLIPGSCGMESASSYPFAVAKTDVVSGDLITSFSTMNFPDACGPAMNGEPLVQR